MLNPEGKIELRFRRLEEHFTEKRADNTFRTILDSNLPTEEKACYLRHLYRLLDDITPDPFEVRCYRACQKHDKGNTHH